MEIKTVKREQIGEAVHSNDKRVWIRYHRFDKVRVNRDKLGEVVSEVPFTEYVYSLFVVGNKSSLWIKSDSLFSLREALDLLAGVEEEPVELVVEQVKRG